MVFSITVWRGPQQKAFSHNHNQHGKLLLSLGSIANDISHSGGASRKHMSCTKATKKRAPHRLNGCVLGSISEKGATFGRSQHCISPRPATRKRDRPKPMVDWMIGSKKSRRPQPPETPATFGRSQHCIANTSHS